VHLSDGGIILENCSWEAGITPGLKVGGQFQDLRMNVEHSWYGYTPYETHRGASSPFLDIEDGHSTLLQAIILQTPGR
jgi:hypothetical protein